MSEELDFKNKDGYENILASIPEEWTCFGRIQQTSRWFHLAFESFLDPVRYYHKLREVMVEVKCRNIPLSFCTSHQSLFGIVV